MDETAMRADGTSQGAKRLVTTFTNKLTNRFTVSRMNFHQKRAASYVLESWQG